MHFHRSTLAYDLCVCGKFALWTNGTLRREFACEIKWNVINSSTRKRLEKLNYNTTSRSSNKGNCSLHLLFFYFSWWTPYSRNTAKYVNNRFWLDRLATRNTARHPRENQKWVWEGRIISRSTSTGIGTRTELQKGKTVLPE